MNDEALMTNDEGMNDNDEPQMTNDEINDEVQNTTREIRRSALD
jgi:hypothetical protein